LTIFCYIIRIKGLKLNFTVFGLPEKILWLLLEKFANVPLEKICQTSMAAMS